MGPKEPNRSSNYDRSGSRGNSPIFIATWLLLITFTQAGKEAAKPDSTLTKGNSNEKIAEDIEEFFSVRNIDESEEYFTKHPSEDRHRLVERMVSRAIELEEADGKLVADAFARVAERKLCSISVFEEGFLPVAELLDDIAIDAPEAFRIMATMMKGAGLDKDEERQTRIVQKSMNRDKLFELLVYSRNCNNAYRPFPQNLDALLRLCDMGDVT